MKTYNTPGLSITIIKEGKIILSKGFGVKKVGENNNVDTHTIFEVASMSKPIFAYLVLELVDEGKMSLDKPLDTYLDAPYIPYEPYASKITTRMILTHTSGLPNTHKKGTKLKLLSPPGTAVKYSGAGFKYLQKAVEKVTTKRLDKYSQTKLFDKLKLSRTSYVWKKKFKKDRARSHDKYGNFKRWGVFKKPNAAYSLYSTSNEYAQFILHIINNGKDGLKAKTFKAFTTEAKYVKYKKNKKRTLGWKVYTTKDNRSFLKHTGANNSGFRAYSRFNIKEKSAVVILSNAVNGKYAHRQIIQEIDKFR